MRFVFVHARMCTCTHTHTKKENKESTNLGSNIAKGNICLGHLKFKLTTSHLVAGC